MLFYAFLNITKKTITEWTGERGNTLRSLIGKAGERLSRTGCTRGRLGYGADDDYKIHT